MSPTPHAAPALCLALGVALSCVAACGPPDPGEVDRSPVAGATDADTNPGRFENELVDAGPRNNGSLEVSGVDGLSGDAAVDCGPVPTEAAGPAGRGFRITLTPRETAGQQVSLLIPVLDLSEGEGETEGGYRAALTVQLSGEEGTYVESTGDAQVHLTNGAYLATESATHFVSGRFEGRFQGGAGSGTAKGRFERCFYFE